MISIKVKNKGPRVEAYLQHIQHLNMSSVLNKYGQMGVEALSAATPVRTGRTAGSWSYEIESDRNGAKIYWSNSNINDGVNIAVILQYGHGTRNGGYVQGIDYINPAMKPIFDQLADNLWKEVTSNE